MDRKKPLKRSVSSGFTPENVSVVTDFGRVCSQKLFVCLRCGNTERIKLPQKFIDGINSVSSAGENMINVYAENFGWLAQSVEIKNKHRFYQVCPNCILNDIKIAEAKKKN